MKTPQNSNSKLNTKKSSIDDDIAFMLEKVMVEDEDDIFSDGKYLQSDLPDPLSAEDERKNGRKNITTKPTNYINKLISEENVGLFFNEEQFMKISQPFHNRGDNKKSYTTAPLNYSNHYNSNTNIDQSHFPSKKNSSTSPINQCYTGSGHYLDNSTAENTIFFSQINNNSLFDSNTSLPFPKNNVTKSNNDNLFENSVENKYLHNDISSPEIFQNLQTKLNFIRNSNYMSQSQNYFNSLKPKWNVSNNQNLIRNKNDVIKQVPHQYNFSNNNKTFQLQQHFTSFQTQSQMMMQDKINFINNAFYTSAFPSNNTIDMKEIEKNLNIIGRIDEQIYLLLGGRFLCTLKNQHGCKLISKFLSSTHINIIKLIFEEIKIGIVSLFLDPYGSSFCPKLFEVLDRDNRIIFILLIRKEILSISTSKSGSYPLQAIFENVENVGNETEKFMLTNKEIFTPEILSLLSQDLYGAHVIEKIISCFPEESIQFIYAFALENFILLCNQSNGLCIIKKIILHCESIYTREKILNELIKNALTLIQNPYGNYAIQTALEVI
jgi:hypothetical protein